MIALLIDGSRETIGCNSERYNVDRKCEWDAFFEVFQSEKKTTQSICFLMKQTPAPGVIK